jgi:hypothetical protein
VEVGPITNVLPLPYPLAFQNVAILTLRSRLDLLVRIRWAVEPVNIRLCGLRSHSPPGRWKYHSAGTWVVYACRYRLMGSTRLRRAPWDRFIRGILVRQLLWKILPHGTRHSPVLSEPNQPEEVDHGDLSEKRISPGPVAGLSDVVRFTQGNRSVRDVIR